MREIWTEDVGLERTREPTGDLLLVLQLGSAIATRYSWSVRKH